jgi:hypothetical protein
MIRGYLDTVPEGATPKMISLYTRIPQSSVRGMLTRGILGIENIGVHGLYRSVHKNRDNHIFSYNFHNLILAVHLPNYTKSTVQETHSSVLVNFEFIIGQDSRQATMRISTPTIDGTNYPINISSISLAFELFRKLIKQHADTEITMNDTSVKSIEFNKDYENLKLEGVNSITMENLIEQFKAYQKKDKLRIEHKMKIPINADDLIKLLGVKC